METKEDQQLYDVAVIGAGIHGAGVAQAAAANGLSVLVLEQFEKPGMGTSSKSSKLIHGGLRYLESAQFKLVRECLNERETLLKIAPSLVTLKNFVIPVYRQSKRPRIMIFMGLLLYFILSGFSKNTRFRYLSSKTTQLRYPNLNTKNLLGAFEYQEAQTDDQRLTSKVIDSAKKFGASVEYNTKIKSIEWQEVNFQIGDHRGRSFQSKTIVNATGPWINEVNHCCGNKSAESLTISLVRGSHIILDVPAMKNCYYLESPEDNRAVFVLPWKNKTMVGTTEVKQTSTEANIDKDEEEYLRKAFLFYFPDVKDDCKIIDKFSGLRVLPFKSDNLNSASRETIIFPSLGKLPYYCIYGGKLTAYRHTAEEVLAKLRKHLYFKNKVSTKAISLEE